MPSTQLAGSFWSLLERSGLLAPPELKNAARILSSHGHESDAGAAQRLVQAKLLTRFQAERLLEGRTRGFLYDHYKVIDLVGSGGMGWVYQAENTVTGETVALKVLLEQLQHDRGMLARFQQEARVGLRLIHPNIVRTYELGSAGGLPYVIMEFVNGASLLELLARCHHLPWPQACEYARQAALGLHHAHHLGLVHRDVKPTNLLIDQTGRVRLLDFGLSMIREGEAGDEFSMAMIFGHQCVGTAEYMAPEQADDSLAVDGRADVYSLGVTLFAALTGSLPFRANTAAEMIHAHRHDRPRPLREMAPSVPAGVADIVYKMLEKDRDRRFDTAAEAAAALSQWAQPSPAEFDFDAIVVERKQRAQQRQASLPKSRATLASSTARPATISSVAHARTDTQRASSNGGSPSVRSARVATPAESGSTGSQFGPVMAAGGAHAIALAVESNAVLTSLNNGREIPLLKDRIVIGRNDECDMQIADPAVSSRHCELRYDGFEWWITDLQSRNGTRVNGTAISYHALRPGDEITIGNDLRFRISYTLDDADSATTRRSHAWSWLALIAIAALAAATWWWFFV